MGCLLPGAAAVRTGTQWLGLEEKRELCFAAAGSEPPGSERTCLLAAAQMVEHCKAKDREAGMLVRPWKFPAGETVARKRRGSQAEELAPLKLAVGRQKAARSYAAEVQVPLAEEGWKAAAEQSGEPRRVEDPE